MDLEIVSAEGYLLPYKEFENICSDLRKQLLPLKQQEEQEKKNKEKEEEAKQVQNNTNQKKKKLKRNTTSNSNKQEIRTSKEDSETFNEKWFSGYGVEDESDGSIEEFVEDSEIRILNQWGYGETGNEQVLIYWNESATLIMSQKVGMTPFSLLRKHYYGISDEIIGLANTHFAVKTEFSEENLEFKAEMDKYMLDGQMPSLFIRELAKILQTKYYKRYHKWLINGYN